MAESGFVALAFGLSWVVLGVYGYWARARRAAAERALREAEEE